MIFKHKGFRLKDFLILASIIIVAMIFLFYSKEKIDSAPITGVGLITDGTNTGYVDNNSIYEQELNLDVSSISAIGIMFHTYTTTIKDGELFLTIKDGEKILHTQKINLSTIIDNKEHLIEFGKDIKIDSNTKMTLEFSNIKPDESISMDTLKITTDKAEDKQLAFSYVTTEKDSFYYKYLIIITAVILLTILIYVLFKYTEVSLETSFVLVMLVLGIIYSFIVKPLAAPDEVAHVYSAYRVSNQILGIEDTGDFVKMREEDWLYSNSFNISRKIYNQLDSELFEKVVKDNIIETNAKYIRVPAYKYTVSGIGITVGRILDFNFSTCLMIARFFNMIFYIGIVYLVMKWMPFGKHIIYLISLIPVSLQQINSISYDNFVYALAFLIIGLTLKIAYGEYKKKHIVILVISSLLLIPCKQFAYFPISLVPIIILWKKINPSKKTISNLKKIILSGVILGILAFVAIIVYYRFNPFNVEGVDLSKEFYNIPYLLSNPTKMLDLTINTFLHRMDRIFLTMFGGVLGHFTLMTQVTICAVFMLLIGLSALKTEDEKQYVTTYDKTVFLGISILCFAFIHMGMLIGWTYMTDSSIDGVQGRYFTPFLPLTILAFRGSNIVLKKDINKNLILIALVLNIIVLTTILQNLM